MKGISLRRQFVYLSGKLCSLGALVISIWFNCLPASAQSAEFTQNTAGSHAMTLQVPLANYPGRGINLPVTLSYSTQGLWRVGFINSISLPFNVRRTVAEAIYAEHSTAGWTTSLDVPKVEWPRQNDVYWYTGRPYTQGTHSPYTYRIAQVFIHMPGGVTHEFRKQDAVYADNGSIDMIGTFYAVDGSRMRYDSTGQNTGILYLPDGARYVLNGSSSTQFIDRNGNTLNYNGSTGQWTDTMNRVLNMPWPANPGPGDYTYSLPGFSSAYTLRFNSLSNALTPDTQGQTPALKAMGDYFLADPNSPPSGQGTSNFPQPTVGTTLFFSGYSDPEETTQSYAYVLGRGQSGSSVFNPTVLTEIVLPNGQSYKFSYNIYGELDKVVYPMGAYQRYQYGPVGAIGIETFPFTEGSRGMTSRWVSPKGTGGADEAQWQYSNVNTPMIMTAPDGTQTHTYLFIAPGFTNNFGYQDARQGMLTEERIYAPASQGGAMLRRTLYEYAQTSVTINKPVPPNTSNSGTYTAYRNARPTKTVSLVLDTGGSALASATTSNYDVTYQTTVGPETTQTADYPFFLVNQTTAQTGDITQITLPSALRSYEKSLFLTTDANYRNRNILGLATSTVVKNGAGTIVAQLSFTYDEAAYPVIPIGTVVGWTDPGTNYRGNLTTTSRWLNVPTSTWLATHSQYDQCGSIRKAWDALGRLSQVDYSSTYHYAYGTTSTSEIADANGTYALPAAHVRTSVYDFDTGLVTSTTDANGRTTSFEYNDPLKRVTKVTRPDGGWTSSSYSDVPGNIYVRHQSVQQTTPTQQVTDVYIFLDKAGRSSRSFAKEGTTYLTADTQYDNMGRIWRTSNPYRTTALTDAVNPSNNWITTAYDSLSRQVTLTTPDNAQITTNYGANLTAPYLGTTATATDQTGKKRRSVTDAQGRLIQVIEDPDSSALISTYTYDVHDNLRKVEQGAQTRYFGYDSLSRLIRTRAVEQTINAALAWTDPVTGYSGGWTSATSYDAVGNITSRIDARNITTNFTYDALNRVTTIRYVNDPQSTPGVDNYYDGYKAGTNQNIPDSVGRLWQIETIGQVRTTIDSFDTLGRVLIQRQQFWTGSAWGTSYETRQTYNLAGQVISQTYPSNRTTAYEYDESGRLKKFSGDLGGASRTYADSFEYSDWSGLQQEKFGTDTALYHKQRFNVRGQVWDMRLSTVSFATDAANGDRGAIVNYYNSGFTQGGSGTDNTGQLLRQETYVPGSNFYQQTFAYDSLNRLKSVSEKLNGTGTDSFKQEYGYDQYGNRTVDQNLTSPNVPRPNYTVDTATNHLTAPAGFAYGYDNAGNQTNDTYTGGGQREFDAENRLARAQGAGQWHSFKYSGTGKRVRRIISGVETWLIYGINGELVAEYAAAGATNSPLKEYGYRSGQLLIIAAPSTLSAPAPSALTAAPGSSGAPISVSWSAASGATNYRVERKGAGTQYVLAGTTSQTSLLDNGVSLGNAYLYRVCAADAGGNCTSVFANIALATAVTFTDANIVSMLDDPTGVTVTSMKLEHITELRAAVNAVRTLASLPNATWTNGTLTRYVSTINADDVRDLRTNLNQALLALNLTLSTYADDPLNGAPNGTLIRKIHITQLRQAVTSGSGTSGGGSAQPNVNWLVTDHLGTPRMVVDSGGTLAGVKRNDYLPFGEDLATLGGRTTGQGYGTDTTRQKFTGYEAEDQISLNYAQARYQSAGQGRFVSVDPVMGSAEILNPQSWNRYSYVLNSPVNMTDPTGMMPWADASTSWADYCGMLAGGNSGGPETGRSIIAAAMARQDRGIADLLLAKQLNDLIRKGKITREEVEAIIKNNENLQLVKLDEPGITIKKVEVLETGPNPSVLGEAKKSEYSGRFYLDLEAAGVDPNGIITIKVTFTFVGARPNPDYEEVTTVPEKGRWELLKEVAGSPGKTNDYQSMARTGTITFRIKERDKEGVNNNIKVKIGGDWTASILDKGKVNDRRTVFAQTLITVYVGSRDGNPKSRP